MDLVDSDKAKNVATPVWGVYHQIVDAAEGKKVSPVIFLVPSSAAQLM